MSAWKTWKTEMIGIVLVGSVATGCGSDADPEPGARAAGPFPDSIRAELVELGRRDQEARADLSGERMQDTAVLRSLLRGDSARSARLRAIVDRHGWPDSSRAGSAAANAAFLVLQHSPDGDFQERMIPVLEERASEGSLPPSEVAMLVDRVRVQDGTPQRYGTQFSVEDERLVLDPVEDPEGLDERRRRMGLPPMETYVEMLEDAYDMPVSVDSVPSS